MNRTKFDRQKQSNRATGGGGWEIVFTGFILILLCFFIMLSSFATLEQSKISRFVKSFVDAVSIFSGGLSLDSGKEVVVPSGDMVPIRSDLAEIFKALQIFTTTYGFEEQVDIDLTARGLEIRLSEKALFASGSAELSRTAHPLIDKVGGMITAGGFAVRIEGHTDNMPIHNDRYPSNWELSTARAVAVLRYLLERFDIPAQQLSAVGMGEFHPRLPNTSPANRAANRRVEIIFSNGGPQ